jgi:hypothetical protein
MFYGSKHTAQLKSLFYAAKLLVLGTKKICTGPQTNYIVDNIFFLSALLLAEFLILSKHLV